ncbi:MAG: hypothetical protein FWD71_09405, partial [Oscillospiraceae bacterium]|nr:hypothetical protein [Oscillospiraceae bacterium]
MENTENKSQPMYLLSYDHGGYILWGEYLKNQLQSAYDWLEKYPCFKIGLDNECFAYDIYSQISPDIITGIQDALKKYKNRFAIGSSTYGQPLSLFINEESNIRQITYAVYTNKKYFNSTPPVFVISEHALHSQIPQIIAQAGYSGAIMRTHFMMYGYNPTYASPFGWWEGSDGTRIRTVPTYYGEGAAFAVATLDNVILTRWPDNTPHSLEEFAEKFRDIKPLLASRFDDITLRCEGLVSHVEKNPGKYKFILLEELLDLYDKNPADAYVASPNNFKARMPWGYCGNEIWNNCRRAEINVITAEKLNAVAVLTNGNYSDNCAEIEESWKYLLAAQHHDVQICGLISDAREFLSKSLDLSEKAFQSSIKYLSGKISYEAGGTYVNVFNPNSWECASIVTAEIKFPRSASNLHYKGFYAVFDDDEKIPCDVQALDVKGGYIRRANITFCAKAAALTFKSYKIEGVEEPFAPEIKYEDNIINSKYYIVKLNENGIVSVYDKLSEKTVINSENGSLFKGVINGVACCSSGKWNVFAEGRGAKAVYHGDIGGISIIFTLSIRHDIKRLECHVRFFHNGELIGSVVDASKVQFHENTNGFIHEDKLCFALSPVFINNGQMTKIRDIPFMIAETETEQKYIQGNYWTAVSDSVNGVAVFNKGAMCSVYNNGELLIPLEYANHYVWGDRYLYGEYTHEFALIPFTDIWQKADIHRKALEYEYPFAVDVINNASARS